MAESMKLRVQTGAVSVQVEDENGNPLGQFEFNPSDSNILTRYGTVAEFFNGISLEQDLPDQEQIAAMTKLADDIARQFDYLLDAPVSQQIFAKCGPLTVTKKGDFFFEQILSGIGALIQQATKKRLDKKLARIRRATAPYEG